MKRDRRMSQDLWVRRNLDSIQKNGPLQKLQQESNPISKKLVAKKKNKKLLGTIRKIKTLREDHY